MDSVIGIDAGGSGVRAVALHGDSIVHRGSGGPGNPLAVTARELAAHYSSALDGFPAVRAAVVCAGGAGSPRGRARLRRTLAPLLAETSVTVLPDYAAAWSVAPAATQVVVIAGTGSVVTSRGPGGYVVTGGAGRPGGDPGSALRLGRVALARGGVPCGEWPAAEIAKAARDLTAAAEDDQVWARRALDAEIAVLAEQVRAHTARVGLGPRPTRVGLTGGVFRSPVAVTALRARLGGDFAARLLPLEPVLGAARIAQGMLS